MPNDQINRTESLRHVPTSPLLRGGAAQFRRFVFVGLASNGAAYLAYLALTTAGLRPMAAASLVYGLAAGAGFLAHRRWSFAHEGRLASACLRFIAAHGTGYLLNLGVLAVGVDRFGWPHQLVQAIAILIVACFLFVVFRYFVFASGVGSGR